MRKKLAATLVLQFGLLLALQSQKLHFQQYSIAEGLPHSTVYSVLQDSRGFLWIGTAGGGVARTDGTSFHVFNVANGLTGNVVRAIYEDNQGRIWIGTDQGLNVYDGETLKRFDADPALGGSFVLAITGDKNGNVLVGTRDDGLYIIPAASDNMVLNLSRIDGLVTNLILDIVVTGDNRYWLAMAGGVNVVRFEEKDAVITQLVKGIHIPGEVVTCAAADHVGNVWFGSQNAGIFKVLGEAGKEYQPAEVPEFLKFLADETIWDIQWTDTASCWIATESMGLIRISHNQVNETVTRENGLPTNEVLRVQGDDYGGIWLATGGNGILRYQGDLFTKYELNPNRMGIDVFGMVEETPGHILVATDEGLYEVNTLKGTPSRIEIPGLPSGASITSIALDRSGKIWLGTSHGLFEKGGNRASYSHYNAELNSSQINTLFIDHMDYLWVGTNNGYNICTESVVHNMNEESGLINNEVQTIIQDRKGNIWLGTLGGLVRRTEHEYQDFNEEEGLTNLQIHSLAIDSNDHLWIGTFGGGIYIMNNHSGSLPISQIPGSEKLTSPNIYSLIWEEDQALIAGTESGFDKIILANDTVRQVIHFDAGDGFSEGSNNLNAVFRSSDGTIWFGTSNSLVSYSPEGPPMNSAVPIAYIENLRLNFQEQDWSSSFETSRWFNLPMDLVLPCHQNHLTFDYTAIQFDNPGDIGFSYFLRGQSKSWSPYSTERSVTFQGLPPGEYSLRLKARTKYGIESEEISFDFRIKPPFWMTGWFIVSSVLILIAIILLIIRLRVRKLRMEKIRLERIVELRTWEITQQKEQIEEQNNVLVSQQKEITDSIRYAERIQTAILPEEQLLKDCFRDYFIMLHPQHIVSGDFYWIGSKNDHLIFSAVDCTGHGVPGAFMSMLGVSFMNKIVNEDEVVMPAEILNALRDNILSVFHYSKETEEGTHDGMDVALCSYDKVHHKLYYAGAMNPLFQVRKENGDYQLIEHLPDKMPVANYSIMDPFKQKEIELREGDALYLFSDGYSDQFGGLEGKKFMKKRFKKMLLSHQEKSMTDQKLAFQQNLSDWMRPPENIEIQCFQTDDILIIGIRL
ncbi:MAG: two-component regulator propeller domain-containing protein [Bacteroidota bacterium]